MGKVYSINCGSRFQFYGILERLAGSLIIVVLVKGKAKTVPQLGVALMLIRLQGSAKANKSLLEFANLAKVQGRVRLEACLGYA
ncbi:MAG: hypothetical protein ABL984_06655 [Pyrinomonadaceae bacterium]